MSALPKHGDRSPDGRKVYLEGGPPGDPHATWSGPFPPANYVEPPPTVGMPCAVVQGDVVRRAVIAVLGDRRIDARLEYKRHAVPFKRRSDGLWIEDGLKGRDAPRLVLGLSATNFKQFKKWYTDDEVRCGWVLE